MRRPGIDATQLDLGKSDLLKAKIHFVTRGPVETVFVRNHANHDAFAEMAVDTSTDTFDAITDNELRRAPVTPEYCHRWTKCRARLRDNMSVNILKSCP